MNKIYKIKTNSLGNKVVCSELAKNKGGIAVASILLAALLAPNMAQAAYERNQIDAASNTLVLNKNDATTTLDNVSGSIINAAIYRDETTKLEHVHNSIVSLNYSGNVTGVHSSLVIGEGLQLNGQQKTDTDNRQIYASVVSGDDNVVNNRAYSSIISGAQNQVKDVNNVISAGSGNRVSDQTGGLIVGRYNTANTENSLLTGQGNKIGIEIPVDAAEIEKVTANPTSGFTRQASARNIAGGFNNDFSSTVVKDSIISGQTLQSAVTNDSIDLEGSTVNRSILTGLSNQVKYSSDSVMSGRNNKVYNLSNSQLSGMRHNIKGTAHNSNILGSDFSLAENKDFTNSLALGASNNVNNVFSHGIIAGSHSDVNGVVTGSMILGQYHNVNNVASSFVSGDGNETIGEVESSIIGGGTNGGKDIKYSVIHGRNNRVNEESQTSILSGRNNSLDYINNSFVTGNLNEISLVEHSIVSGVDNKGNRATASSVSGFGNNFEEIEYSSINGEGNKVISSESSNISGNRNKFGNVTSSVATGFEHNIGDVSYSIVSGAGIKGEEVVHSIVSGAVNTFKGMEYSMIGGADNKINNASTGLLVFGKGNEISSESGDTLNSVVLGEGNELTATQGFIIGSGSKVSVDKGVAIGDGANANREAGSTGWYYGEEAPTTQAFTSTTAAIAVGDAEANKLAQIIGVAAGTEDTDAVNVAQLKQVATTIEQNIDELSTTLNGRIDVISSGVEGALAEAKIKTKLNPTDDRIQIVTDENDANQYNLSLNDVARESDLTIVKTDLRELDGFVGEINKNVIEIADEVNKGVVFAADSGSKKYDLGETVKVKGGKNVKTKVSAEGIEVGLADDVEVNSITAGGVKISSNGVDMNGKKVTNLVQGEVSETSTDAVTGAQLHEVKQAVSRNDSRITGNTRRINGLEGRMDRVEKQVKKVDDKRKAGSASALATAGLPQPHKEGQSGIVAGVGQYGKETAVAVGYARVSDNGKWIFRTSATTNTQKEFGGQVGLGYFW